MKKLLLLSAWALVFMLGSFSAQADGYGWGHDGGYGHHRHHGHHRHYREHYYPRPMIGYPPPPPQVIYYPPPPVAYYPPPPPVRYYPPASPAYYPPQHYQDPRNPQGLVGSVIGGVFGYQMGGGNPVATGIGAAAGSFLGNGMAGRW